MAPGTDDSNASSPLRELAPLDKAAFDYLLGLEVGKASRYLYYFSLLAVRIDQGNEKTGQNGEVGKVLSGIIQEEIRGTDLLGLGNGNNYFIVLQYADLENASTVGNRIRERVDHYNFKTESGKEHQTVSIGVSCFPSNSNDLEGLVSKASENMNMARDKGGNRVFFTVTAAR